jgi:ribosome maturation factor RimP
MSNKEQVAAVITPAIQALGFYVEDISITIVSRPALVAPIIPSIPSAIVSINQIA